jgi:hypothetical protein
LNLLTANFKLDSTQAVVVAPSTLAHNLDKKIATTSLDAITTRIPTIMQTTPMRATMAAGVATTRATMKITTTAVTMKAIMTNQITIRTSPSGISPTGMINTQNGETKILI